jgi:hypothetical protein
MAMVTSGSENLFDVFRCLQFSSDRRLLQTRANKTATRRSRQRGPQKIQASLQNAADAIGLLLSPGCELFLSRIEQLATAGLETYVPRTDTEIWTLVRHPEGERVGSSLCLLVRGRVETTLILVRAYFAFGG